MNVEQHVAVVWAERAAAERKAVARFTRLVDGLKAVEADPALVEIASLAISDETRHIELCTGVARSFGGEAEEHAPKMFDGPKVAPFQLPLRARVLYEAVGDLCVIETLNVSLLTVTLDHSRHHLIRSVVREILRDEVRHSRLGWAHLNRERQLGQGNFLPELLPFILEHAVSSELFEVESPQENERELLALGNLSRAVRLEIFIETLRSVIFPGFEQLGLSTAAALDWLSRLTSSGATAARYPGDSE